MNARESRGLGYVETVRPAPAKGPRLTVWLMQHAVPTEDFLLLPQLGVVVFFQHALFLLYVHEWC